MKDINGVELRKGGEALLLCEILDVDDGGVHLRIMNSDHEILVGCKYDEVLGGIVADSELTAFHADPVEAAVGLCDDHADGVKIGTME